MDEVEEVDGGGGGVDADGEGLSVRFLSLSDGELGCCDVDVAATAVDDDEDEDESLEPLNSRNGNGRHKDRESNFGGFTPGPGIMPSGDDLSLVSFITLSDDTDPLVPITESRLLPPTPLP